MNRVIDIQKYWTDAIKEIDAFEQIAIGENPELNELTVCIKRLLLDAFVKDSTIYGVERWEKILKIAPATNETIEDRKVRILTYLNMKLPYTWKVLENTIKTVVGENNYTMNYNNRTYTLNIHIKVNSLNQYQDINNLLEKVVPQNTIINLTREGL